MLFLCAACNKPLPALDGVDTKKWQGDKNGCGGIRITMRTSIDREKEKLLGLDQMQIVDILGRPDRNELSTRNQKFFHYFIDPAPSCPTATDSLTEKLVIRFNAVGLAKEVAIE
jgi:hypothetical protein